MLLKKTGTSSAKGRHASPVRGQVALAQRNPLFFFPKKKKKTGIVKLQNLAGA